jgi:Amidohydrolase family
VQPEHGEGGHDADQDRAGTADAGQTLRQKRDPDTNEDAVGRREQHLDPRGAHPGARQRRVGPGTAVLDHPGLTVLPGFIDTHSHLIFAGRSVHDVPVERATSIAELVDLIRRRAEVAPAGQ